MTTSELDQLPDEALVRLFQARRAGDDRAFAALFRRHHHSVWRLCYRFASQAADVEDLVQEVFLRVYRGLDQFEGRSSYSTWLYRVTLSTGQNAIRSRRRRPVLDDAELDDLADRLTDGSSAEGSVLDEVPTEQLAQAMEALAPDALKVLCLREIEGLPYTELAERLGIGVSAAKMRVQRARLALLAAYHKKPRHKPETSDEPEPNPKPRLMAGIGPALPGSTA